MEFKWRIGQIDKKYCFIKYAAEWNDSKLTSLSVVTTNTIHTSHEPEKLRIDRYHVSGQELIKQFEEQGFVGGSGSELLSIIVSFFKGLNETSIQYDPKTACTLNVSDDALHINIFITESAAASATLKRVTKDDDRIISSLLELTQELCTSLWFRGQFDLVSQVESAKRPVYKQLLKSLTDTLQSNDQSRTMGVDLAKVFLSRDKCFSLKQKMNEIMSTNNKSIKDKTPESDFIEVEEIDNPQHRELIETTKCKQVDEEGNIPIKAEVKDSIIPKLEPDVVPHSQQSPNKKRKFGKVIVSPSKRIKKEDGS